MMHSMYDVRAAVNMAGQPAMHSSDLHVHPPHQAKADPVSTGQVDYVPGLLTEQNGKMQQQGLQIEAEGLLVKPVPPPHHTAQEAKQEDESMRTEAPAGDEDSPSEQQGKPSRRGNPAVMWLPTVVQQKKHKQDTDNQQSSEEVDGSDSDYSEEAEVVLERQVSAEQAEQDTLLIRLMPELCCILEFLYLFRQQLNLDTIITFPSLLDALVHSPGPGLLASLHTDLLRGVVTSKALNEHNWTHYLSSRLQLAWTNVSRAYGPPPFQAPKHEEAQAYAALPARDRVLALKALCDIRLERDDLRTAIEAAVSGGGGGGGGRGGSKAAKEASKAPPGQPPGRASRSSAAATRAKSSEPDELTAELMRKQPLGVDGSGFTYWWLDWCDMSIEGGCNLGSVLIREGPPVAVKSSTAPGPATSSSYQVPPLPSGGQWEVAACNLDELESFGTKMGRSLRPADKKISEQINHVLVPELKSRIDDQEKWRKAKERTRKMLGLDTGLSGLERGTRQRKPVNYRDDAYDKAISAAIRKGGGDDAEEQRGGRRRAAAVSRGSVEPGAGRRGRSRGSDVDLIALDMDGPTRRGVLKATSQDPEQESEGETTEGEQGVSEQPEQPPQPTAEQPQAAQQAEQPPGHQQSAEQPTAAQQATASPDRSPAPDVPPVPMECS